MLFLLLASKQTREKWVQYRAEFQLLVEKKMQSIKSTVVVFGLVASFHASLLAQEWDKEKLFEATRAGNIADVTAALDAGVDVNSTTEYNSTALFFACDRGNLELVKLLLDRGADPNIEDSFYSATPMTWAQQNDNFDIVLLLLAKGGKGADGMLLSAIAAVDAKKAKQILDTKAVSPAGMKKAYKMALGKESDELKELFKDYDSDDMAEAFKVSAERLRLYVGKYKGGPMTVSVSAKDEELSLAFAEGSPSVMTPTAQDEFMLGASTIKFEMDGDSVKQMELSFGPQTFKLSPASADDSKPEPKKEGNEAEEKEGAEPKWTVSSETSRANERNVSSANWPSFRGVGSRGVAEGQNPPTKWNVEEKENLLWEKPVDGLGLSCPVIWEDKLFITSAFNADADGSLRIGLYGDVASVEEDVEYEFQVICLNKTSGKEIWKQTAAKKKPAVKRHAKSSHANPTIATDGNHVVAFFSSEGLYCYDMDGNLKWQKDLGVLDSGWFYDPGYQWGFAASPIIYDGNIILQCDIQKGSFIASYDAATGTENWRIDREEIPSWSCPTVHKFGDVPMLLTAATKAARGYDARTGEQLWELREHSEIVVPTPFVAHDLIFIASGYSPIQPIYAIKPTARGDISLPEDQLTNEHIPWSVKRGGPYLPTPIVYGDYLYCCANSGVLTCYDAVSGKQVYKKRMRAEGGSLSFTASPLAGDGHLYFTAEDGRVLVVKAGPEFELVDTNTIGKSVLATPAISSGVMYFRTENSVVAVGEVKSD